MSDHELTIIQHDGMRNYFGGRNLIPDSRSPVMPVSEPEGELMTAAGARSVGREGMFTIMSAGETPAVQAAGAALRALLHDGARNYLGGRNMIPDSESPDMLIDEDFEIVDIRPRSAGLRAVTGVSVLTATGASIVHHDGIRNYFGGRNMVPASESPDMPDVWDAALPIVGIARAGITVLYAANVVDMARADMVALEA